MSCCREFSCPYRELGPYREARPYRELGLPSRSRVLVSLSRTRSIFTVESSRIPRGRWEPVSFMSRCATFQGSKECGREGKRKGGWQDACVREGARAGEADRRSLTNSRKGREKQHVGETPSPAVVLGDTGGNDGGGLSCSEAVQSIMSIFHAFHALKRPLPSEG